MHYTYDAMDRLQQVADGQGETLASYSYNHAGGLRKLRYGNGIQIEYDHQGGIVEEKGQAGTRRFTYNSRHQQIWVETETGNVQENRYDAEGLCYELLENGRRTTENTDFSYSLLPYMQIQYLILQCCIHKTYRVTCCFSN